MPTYDYLCEQCAHTFVKVHSMYDDRPVTCPECEGGDTHRVPCAPAVVMDWHRSEAVHNSTRFRPAVRNMVLKEN